MTIDTNNVFDTEALQEAHFGLEVLHQDLLASGKEISKGLEQLDNVEAALEGLYQTSVALESIKELTLTQAGLTIDLMDIGLSRIGLGVEDVYPAVVDDIGGKPSQINAEGFLKRFLKHIMEVLGKVWEHIVSLWHKVTDFNKASIDVLNKQRTLLQKLKTGKAAQKVDEVDIGLSAYYLSNQFKGEIIPTTSYKDIEVSLSILELVDEKVGNNFIPSYTRCLFHLKEAMDTRLRNLKAEDASQTLDAGILEALRELDLKSISELASTQLDHNDLAMIPGVPKNSQGFMSPILPSGRVIIITIPEKNGDKDPLLAFNVMVASLPLNTKEKVNSLKAFSLDQIGKIIDVTSQIVQYAGNTKTLAFVMKTAKDIDELLKQNDRLIDAIYKGQTPGSTLDKDTSGLKLTSTRDSNVVRTLISTINKVGHTSSGLCLGINHVNTTAIKHAVRVNKLMLDNFSFPA